MRNTVIVEGIGDLRDALGMVLEDGWVMDPPEPVMRMVDVPGRSGRLDLTDAMGGPFFSDRQQSFVFGVFGIDHEVAARRAIRALHGMRLRYSVSMDPGYTYVGRWSLSEIGRPHPNLTTISATVIAEPYRYRQPMAYKLNPMGGRMYRFECGDKPVRPTVECNTPVRVEFNGKATLLPAGTWRLNDVLFERGWNDLYLNSWVVRDTTLTYLERLRLSEMNAHTLDELQRLSSGAGLVTRTLDDMHYMTLSGMGAIRLMDMPYASGGAASAPPVDTTVYLTYEWGDL